VTIRPSAAKASPVRKITGSAHSASGEPMKPSTADHQQDRGTRQRGLGCRPQQLAGQHVLQGHRRVHDRLPGALHVHAREGRVQRFEGGRIHGRRAHRAGGEEGDVGHAADLGQHAAEAVAQAEQVDHRVGQVAQHGRDRQLLPDQEIAPPDGEGTRERRGSSDSVFISIPQFPSGQLEEHVLQVGRPVQGSAGGLAARWASSGWRRRRSRRRFRRWSRQRRENRAARAAAQPKRPRRRPRPPAARCGAAISSRGAAAHDDAAGVDDGQARHRRSASSMKWVVSRMVLPWAPAGAGVPRSGGAPAGRGRWWARRGAAVPGR
jgi:hypothetical protein